METENIFAYTNISYLCSMKTSESCFSKCLYFTSNALARKVEKLAIDSWKKTSLSPSHGYLLLMTLEQPGVQPSLIADHLQLQPSTVTRLIEKLEEKKLVVRTTEGKITNVYPTPKAKNLLPTLQQCQAEFYRNYSALLGREESEVLAKNLAHFSDKLNP